MGEPEWRPINGWTNVYEISNTGIVRSLPRTREVIIQGVPIKTRYPERILKASLKNGYPFVTLRDGSKKQSVYIHRVVCEAYNGPPPKLSEVAHNDGTRCNNNADNLRWATRKENMQDKINHGTAAQRGRLASAKLRENQIPEILALLKSGILQRKVASKFGVTQSVISRIKTKYERDFLCQ